MNFNFRRANLDDIDFIIEAVISSEKSGTEILPLCKIFDINEKELTTILKSIFAEEIEGCEFSVSSFLIAEESGKKAAAVAGWIEGQNESGLPSSLIKANLLSFFLSKEKIEIASKNSELILDVLIERQSNTFQIEYVYVNPAFRGLHLASLTIKEHFKLLESGTLVQVQVFENNRSAVKSYESIGFKVKSRHKSDYPKIRDFLPDSSKLLMTKIIYNG